MRTYMSIFLAAYTIDLSNSSNNNNDGSSSSSNSLS